MSSSVDARDLVVLLLAIAAESSTVLRSASWKKVL